jgi:RND superfamily putative drug exporter
METLSRIVTGRRSKWAVLVVWIIAMAIMSPLGGKLADETSDDTASFLPESAESTRVVELLDEQFPGGETSLGLMVYEREGGFTAADKAKIEADTKAVTDAKMTEEDADESDDDEDKAGDPLVPLTEAPIAPFGPNAGPGLVSPEGDIAYTVFTTPTDFAAAADWGKDIRDIVEESPSEGMDTYLTGDVGFSADAEEVFGELDVKLLLATVFLVLILLGAIYRAVLVAITPIIVVFFAYTVATGFIYLYAKSGATVSSNGTSILIVLMFGVGTDYCLLLVSRYREELHRIEDKHEAMARALSRSGPAILASGATVALAMLVLVLADARSTNTLGPVAAIGVTSAFLAGLTLLPALLTIFGRAGFWPRSGMVAYDPEHPAITRQGLWRKFGDRVLESPAQALLVTVVIFGAAAIGITSYKVDYSTTNFFKKSVEAVEGFKVLERGFPAGTSTPTTLIVTRDDGPVTDADVNAAVAKVGKAKGVATATPTGLKSEDGESASVDIVLNGDPYTKKALNQVPGIRDSVADLGPGVTALVGGGAALQYDFDHAIEEDLKLIAPLALLVIFLILIVLLRALVAPLLLIASVMLSFLATLGLSVLIIRYIVGDPGLDASIPTFAFIFLVALGIDYTIFLMARVREEAVRHGTREGMLRALAATGPVITSAGIILAGTFSVLMTLPVTFTFDLGLMVALGILLDTFVVRTIMVPAAVELIGDKVWWPSTPEAGAGALQEATDGEPPPPPN